MPVASINNRDDYHSALKRIDELFEAEHNTPEGDELETLITLVEKYEEKEFRMAEPEHKELEKHILESKGKPLSS